MASNWSIALGVLGPTLTCVGAFIQFFDWKKSRDETGELSWRRDYISHLEAQIGELRAVDKTRGAVADEGFDVGETLDILQQATEQANKLNRQRLQDLVDKMDASSERRSKFVFVSIGLVLLGTILWAATSFV
ncbi:hypothetical protein BKD09_28045 [Bradyrhizobium japonicum]|uniref:Uncharacterized protein n=1 Tax=Bradyrhizobium japonicum TaxID=375 RepID=A0A1L3FFV6_BRAJP|nr:hypothetical protein [Bradyrhizobium japonicum]APG12193.1 hypothetical protein BKD09_28045 [Bradyrhizobium japonicum]